MTEFSPLGIGEQLEKSLVKNEWLVPTEVQSLAIPAALDGKDLLVASRTGSGKTLAFLLPAMQAMLEDEQRNSATRMLILTPTRELAQQVYSQAELLNKTTPFSSGIVTGGTTYKEQAAMLRKNPEIIVSTPGRLVDHLKKKSIDLSEIEWLVLDEADRMLDMGFSEDVNYIISQCNEERQSLLFSATLQQKGIHQAAGQWLKSPELIEIDKITDQHDKIDQFYLLADDADFKKKVLAKLLKDLEYQKAIIFTNTRDNADFVYAYLNQRQLTSVVIHSDKTQDERNYIMRRFRDGTAEILVATDLAARGIDIPQVELVVNFDLPRQGQDYVHRIGRCGRGEKQGMAISLVTNTGWNFKARIESFMKIKWEKFVVTGFEASYKGPKKVKSSGKAATNKKRGKTSMSVAEKKKLQKGKLKKQRKQAERPAAVSVDGFKPLGRKKSNPEI